MGTGLGALRQPWNGWMPSWESSRTDVGKKTLRPIGDLLGHRNKKERTINKTGQLLESKEWEQPGATGCLPAQPPRLAVRPGSISRSLTSAYHPSCLDVHQPGMREVRQVIRHQQGLQTEVVLPFNRKLQPLKKKEMLFMQRYEWSLWGVVK